MIRVGRCRSCDAYVVWMRTNTGKSMPVDADSIDEDELERAEDGTPLFDAGLGHVSHFATCPHASEHRRR